MNTRTEPLNDRSTPSRVYLWIDAVGGYRLLQGDRFTVGGMGGEPRPDIAVRCGWSSRQATLQRIGEDFWLSRAAGDHGEQKDHDEPCDQIDPGDQDDQLRRRGPTELSSVQSSLVQYGVPLVIQSGVQQPAHSPGLTLHKPSSLSHTVVVRLSQPHRFVDPVDGVILMDSTLLIGPGREHHIRVPRLTQQYVLATAGREFVLRAAGRSFPLTMSETLELDDLTLSLRIEF